MNPVGLGIVMMLTALVSGCAPTTSPPPTSAPAAGPPAPAGPSDFASPTDIMQRYPEMRRQQL
jgi:hypothetical protein